MHNEYRVQYLRMDGNWDDWGTLGITSEKYCAEAEMRFGQHMYNGRQFRVVQREVSNWSPCE